MDAYTDACTKNLTARAGPHGDGGSGLTVHFGSRDRVDAEYFRLEFVRSSAASGVENTAVDYVGVSMLLTPKPASTTSAGAGPGDDPLAAFLATRTKSWTKYDPR